MSVKMSDKEKMRDLKETHIIRLTGILIVQDNEHDTVPITDVKFVPIDVLTDYGFSERFMQECKCGFKNVPPYVGKDTFLDFDFIFR